MKSLHSMFFMIVTMTVASSSTIMKTRTFGEDWNFEQDPRFPFNLSSSITPARVSDNFQQRWLAKQPLVKRRRSAGTAPVENDGWSKAADVIPLPLRARPLGKSLTAWLNVTNNDIAVDYGRNVNFSCKNNGTEEFAVEYPGMERRWVKDGDPVTLDSSHKLQTDTFVFFIEEVRPSDAGTYECRMVLDDGTELTADVFTLTVMTSFPTLVVRETEPLALNCRSEALVTFLRNLERSSNAEQDGGESGDDGNDKRDKRAADEDDNSFKDTTAEYRSQEFARHEEGVSQESGFKNVTLTSHARRLARREASTNASDYASKGSITQRWCFQGTEILLFPDDISASPSSLEVMMVATRNVTGDWACQISHVTTARTWRTAWYKVRVASPPPGIELWWRRVLVYPWAVAIVALLSMLAFVGLSILVARLAQENINLEEKFFVIKRKVLRRKDLLWSDSTGEAERQGFRRHPSTMALAARVQTGATKDAAGAGEKKKRAGDDSSSDDEESQSVPAGGACYADGAHAEGYKHGVKVRRGSTDLDAAFKASRAT